MKTGPLRVDNSPESCHCANVAQRSTLFKWDFGKAQFEKGLGMGRVSGRLHRLRAGHPQPQRDVR